MTGSMQFEVIYGTQCVWVNDGGGCLGRFGRLGIDVHEKISVQEETGVQCLYCTHGTTVASDWPRFVDAMLRLHEVDLRDQPVPDWLSDGNAVINRL